MPGMVSMSSAISNYRNALRMRDANFTFIDCIMGAFRLADDIDKKRLQKAFPDMYDHYRIGELEFANDNKPNKG